MSNFDYTAAAVSVTSFERKAVRMESVYASIVAHLNLTPDSDSATLTDAARQIVLIGANNDGTATGASVTLDDLTGRDPGKGSKVRDYWASARRVRIGLVRAIAATVETDDDDDDETETVVNLLTRAGLKADLESVIAAWKSANENN